jgi:hypothetical protein
MDRNQKAATKKQAGWAAGGFSPPLASSRLVSRPVHPDGPGSRHSKKQLRAAQPGVVNEGRRLARGLENVKVRPILKHGSSNLNGIWPWLA